MDSLSKDESLKVQVGVWMCFADSVVQPVETSKIFELLKPQLAPESFEPAMILIVQRLTEFHKDFLGSEALLQKELTSYDRKSFIKDELIHLAEAIAKSDGSKESSENNALAKLKVWLA